MLPPLGALLDGVCPSVYGIPCVVDNFDCFSESNVEFMRSCFFLVLKVGCGPYPSVALARIASV